MDVIGRGAQPQSQFRPAANPAPGSSQGLPKANGKSGKRSVPWLNIATIVLLFSGVILVAGLILLTRFTDAREMRYVNKDGFQAVDIAIGGANGTDQIYFGKIKSITKEYLTLEQVYYIPSPQSKDGNISLAQLVCQLDKPYDQMIINRDQVVYWENLQDDSKVSTTITDYQRKNPNGPSCTTTAAPNSSSSSATGNQSSSSTDSSTTTPTTTTKTNTTSPSSKKTSTSSPATQP